MSRAVIVPFHRYQPHVGLTYKVYFDYFVENLKVWAKEFDKLYLIDSDFGFSSADVQKTNDLGVFTEVVPIEEVGHHWVHFKNIIPKLKEEYMLFLDCDVVITKSGIIDGWFQEVEAGADILTSFDGSGGMTEQIWEKYPWMKENGFARMGSYYFILTRKLLDKVKDFDFAPIRYENFDKPPYISELDYQPTKNDWFDSFGLFTVKALATHPKIALIEDDRGSIYLEDNGSIVKTEPDNRTLGYYHIRNGNLPIYTIDSYYWSKDDWMRTLDITPRRELLRLFAWFQIASGDSFQKDIDKTLQAVNVQKADWDTYIKEFKLYHNI